MNSADLNAQFYNALNGVTMVLKEYNKTVIEVAGHTDSSGSDQYNMQLSERRAQSVASYLSSQGVQSSRLMTVGAGETRPVASNDSEQGRSANRRVEMTIVPGWVGRGCARVRSDGQPVPVRHPGAAEPAVNGQLMCPLQATREARTGAR